MCNENERERVIGAGPIAFDIYAMGRGASAVSR